jgi:transposase
LHRRYLPRSRCDSIAGVTAAPDTPPDDIAALRAALAAEQLARCEAEARASGAEAMVAHLKLLIARLKRDKYGASSERGRKLINQLELELGELVAAASEDATKAEKAADKEGRPRRLDSPPRGQPVRAPLPAHLPRERVVLPSPTACPCCGGKLSKLGEDVTETLEVEPIRWKVIQTVRERFSCRSCETITQPPAPFHPIARGRAGPNLLAMILEAKFGQHLPLNRQSEAYAFQGIELSVSTIADWVGASTANLAPLNALIDAHVLAAERLHGDDTTVPVLAKGKTITGRVWTYVRDDRPFGGQAPPAAMFRYSRDRTAEHPNRHLAGYAGILQATTRSTRRIEYLGRSSRPRVGPMAGANYSSWPSCRAPRSPSRRCDGSMRSLTPSAPSTACPQTSVWPCASSTSRRSSPSSRPGCGRAAANCPGTTRSPRRWTTC